MIDRSGVVASVLACSGGMSVLVGGVHAQTMAFADRAAAAGLSVSHHPAAAVGNEFQCAGGAIGDFDGDGDPDFFMVGGSAGTDKLFINQGDGTFVDQGAAWGVAVTHAGSGACAGDYDNDGDLDLYVTSLGVAGNLSGNTNLLYRNNGNGTFTDVAAAAGVRSTINPAIPLGDAYGACFGDYDLDGDLDLAVAGWLGGNRLFRNNADGTFTDVTSGVIDTDMTSVRGFAPAFVDIDGDRRPELLWVADFFTSRLLHNNGDGTFTDITAASGTGIDSNGMGNASADFDRDGRYDWYVTSRINDMGSGGSGNMLYMNQGSGVFGEVSVAAGVNDGDWGWGADARDFDHDGWPDILATNGWTGPEFATDPTHLFESNADGTFTDVAPASGLAHTGQGRGVATLDADNDGDMDVLIFCNNEPLAYFENQVGGPGANWVKIRLDTSLIPHLAPNGFGSLVEITADGVTQTWQLAGGSNFNATSELVVHAGLASASIIDAVTVTWNDGTQTTIRNVAPSQAYTITARGDCLADLDASGTLDFSDVILFLTGFAGADPQMDFATPFGVYDFSDILAFLGSFGAGCP